MKTTHSKDQQVNQLIDRKKIKPHPHNKMWGKGGNSHKSLGLTISVTGDVEPIRVCKTAESDSDYLILSGHSRFELSSEPIVECKDLGVLTEEEQVLRLIAYNAGHSTHPSKLTAAASYCHKHFPGIAISSIMDAAGIGDNRSEWEEALKLSVKAIEEASYKHRKRTSDSIAASATKGPEAIKETASRSLSRNGTKVAGVEKSPHAEIAVKSSTANDLAAEIETPKSGDFLASDGVNKAQETAANTAESEEPKEIENNSECTANMKAMKAAVGVLNRELTTLGRRSSEEAVYAVNLLVALAEGRSASDHPSVKVIDGLNKKVEEWMEVARTNILEYEAAIEDVNAVFKKWMARPVNGQVVVPAHAISEPFIKRGLNTMKNMDPEVLASQAEAQ